MKAYCSGSCSNLAEITVKSGTITDISNDFLDLTGYSREHFVGLELKRVFAETLKSRIDFDRLSGTAGSESGFLFTKTLAAREVEISVREETQAGEVLYSLKEVPDSRIDEKMRDLEIMFGDNKMGVLIFSAPGLILLKANDFCLKMFDAPYNQKEYSFGRPVEELSISDRGLLTRDYLENVIRSKQSYLADLPAITIFRNGRHYFNSSLTPYIEKGVARYLVAIFIDVTSLVLERQKNEEQKRIIKQQKEQLEAIIENMSDGLIITDKKQNILLVNAAARKYHPDPVLVKNLECGFDLIHVTDQNGDPIQMQDMPAHRAARGEKVKNCRVNFSGPLGEANIEYSSAPLYDSDGSINMVITCARDVTEQVRNANLLNIHNERLLKAQMEKTEALKKVIELKDEFLSLVSHEFKTPISVIISAVQAMEYLCWEQLSDKMRSYIGRIKQNAYRQLRLVNNLLETAKIDSGQVKLQIGNYDIVYLASSITESVRLYANQKEIDLCFSSGMDSKIIGLDDEKFERILLNLLSNAIKFTPRGRWIHVRLSEVVRERKKMISVEVEDEGIGIPEEKQAAIFEKFVQVDSSLARQAEGTGLGLPIVKSFVEALGGFIRVRSTVGSGSVFSVFLPSKLADAAPEKVQALQSSDSRLIQAVAVEFSDLY